MKTLIWKFRYARAIKRLLGLSFSQGWQMAGSALEKSACGPLWEVNDDPVEAAEHERDEWLACSDPDGATNIANPDDASPV